MRPSSWRSATTSAPASVTSSGTPAGDWSAHRRKGAPGGWSGSASPSCCWSVTAPGLPERAPRELAQPLSQGAGRRLGEAGGAPLVDAAPHLGGARAAVDLVRSVAAVAAVVRSCDRGCLDGSELDGAAPHSPCACPVNIVLHHHANTEVRVVVEDYVHGAGARTVTLVSVMFAHTLIGAAGVFAVLKVAFGVAP